MGEETKIENAANKILKAEGWLIEKVKFMNDGYMDRLYTYKEFGLQVWIEWKKPDEGPSPLQSIRLRDFQARGVLATWTDNVNDGVAYCRAAVASKELSSRRDKDAAQSRSSGAISRPRTGEDESSSGSGEDPTSAYVNQ